MPALTFDDIQDAQPVRLGAPLRITPVPRSPALEHPSARDLAIRTIYGEAADEPDEGKAGVAAVIRNRLESGRYSGQRKIGPFQNCANGLAILKMPGRSYTALASFVSP